MTKKNVLSVIARYERRFKRLSVPKKKFPHTKYPKDPYFYPAESWREKLGHCYSMLEEMRGFIKQNRMGKVFRWLGFIQGVLWSLGIYNLESLKSHNRQGKKIRR